MAGAKVAGWGGMNRFVKFAAACIGLSLALAATGHAATYPVEERSVAQLQADMTAGRVTSEALVRAYLARIQALDRNGPRLHSVISVNPTALAQAHALDAERRAKGPRGPLHGVPMVLKDNIETTDPMPTTAGSLALKDNVTGRDSGLAARLRAAGAVILGKANLSEWANFRSTRSISGWSAVGGLVKNPYALDRSACGSSAGSAVAAAASLAAATVGTETDGSITCPASSNGVVGLKPTLGLVSRGRIVPISHLQDTAGPMGRTVADVAALLTVLAGPDPADPATAGAGAHAQDFTAALDPGALKGARLGVLRFATRGAATDQVFEAALARLKAAGAELVEITDYRPPAALDAAEGPALQAEFHADLDAYLATTPAAVRARSLDALIVFNRASPREMALFGQQMFEAAAASPGLDDPQYRAARAEIVRLAGREGIDKLLADYKVEALISPSRAPASRIDLVNGDRGVGVGAGGLAAVAGYPHLTVPMGAVEGLPVGLSLMGPAWSDARLLALGYAFEQAWPARKPPTYAPSVEAGRAAVLSPP